MDKPIELATGFEIQVVERTVYRVRGARRDYFTQKAALNKLAYLIAEREFKVEDKTTNYPDIDMINEDGAPVSIKGKNTPEFLARKNKILDNLGSLIKKERKIKQLQKRYAAAVYEHKEIIAKLAHFEEEIIKAQHS